MKAEPLENRTDVYRNRSKCLKSLDIAAAEMQFISSSLRDFTDPVCVSGVSTGQLRIGSIYQRDQKKFLVASRANKFFLLALHSKVKGS